MVNLARHFSKLSRQNVRQSESWLGRYKLFGQKLAVISSSLLNREEGGGGGGRCGEGGGRRRGEGGGGREEGGGRWREGGGGRRERGREGGEEERRYDMLLTQSGTMAGKLKGATPAHTPSGSL